MDDMEETVDAPVQTAAPEAAPDETRPEPDEATKAYIKEWTSRIANAKEHWEPAFKRMRLCMHIAKYGDTKEWIGKNDDADGRYVVPIAKRHINQAVAQLYAKNPTSFAERKKRRMHTVWDGEVSSLQQATMIAQQATQPPQPGMPAMQVDPMAMAIVQDAMAVQEYIKMIDGLADTLNILDKYYIEEQATGFKQQMKAAVRRTKVCGIAYVTLDFQRILEKRPEVQGQIRDATDQIATAEQLLAANAREPFEDESAKLEELRTTLKDLQNKEYLIVREGPVHGFPRSTQIIVDPCVTHMKTLTGANWWVEEFDMAAEDIERDYKVDVSGKFKKYTPDAEAKPKWSDKQGKAVKNDLARVWKVQDKRTGQEFVICEGFDDYLKPPAAPNVKIERFFTLFPIVFNEIEDEDEQIPPSDVWDIRHTAREYNAARQGLKEHRKQSKPGTYGPSGGLNEKDLGKLASRSSGDHIEIGAMAPGDKLSEKFQPIPVVQIDPKIYDVEPLYNDMLRTVGAQAATQGVTSGDTATESAIAQQSREVSDSSSIDDLDDVLSDLAKARGQLMLLELTKETVIEIVGPGAVWPDMPQSREEIAKDLTLDIKAGSSGRPNKAAKLANMERGMPFIVQLPGMNPTPIGEEYLKLLDIDAEDAMVKGLPSIIAQNAMASKPIAQDGGDDPTKNPGAQGDKGASNAPAAAQNEQGSQPAFPAGAPGNTIVQA